MIEIELHNISKKYGYQTILKSINHTFPARSITGISGRNGSGKSTLLKIISNYLTPSTGDVRYRINDLIIKQKLVSNKIGFCAPYIKVTQEMSLKEVFQFQKQFRPFISDISYKEFLELIELSNPKDKEIRFFSSGMQQKVNLGLTILAKSDLLLLDEPTSYLDKDAKQWFLSILTKHMLNRTIIIASNDLEDFTLTNNTYEIINGQIDFNK